MDIITVNKLLSQYAGDYSVFYHGALKDKLDNYSDKELPFREEFLFFEEKYLSIKKHMLMTKVDSANVVDIGCQYGFQSEIFLDNEYLGIDSSKIKFFNTEKPNVNYIVGSYPLDVEVDLADSTVISCMSLGYFNHKVDEDDSKALDIIVNYLSKAKHLYIAATVELLELLKVKFTIVEEMERTVLAGKVFSMYYFSNND